MGFMGFLFLSSMPMYARPRKNQQARVNSPCFNQGPVTALLEVRMGRLGVARMKKTTAIILSLLFCVLAIGCNPSGCGGATSPGTSTEVDQPATDKGKRKMKIVQLRPEFKENRPMESGSLKPIDPNEKPSSPSEPPSTGN
jgi:hypothetical protein